MDDTLEDLESYQGQVVAELERRVTKLREVDNRVSEAQFHLREANRARSLLSRAAGRHQVEEAHRRALKESVKKLLVERVEALSDLRRAEERLAQVKQRIADMKTPSMDK